MRRARDEAWGAVELLASRLAQGDEAAWHPFLCALEQIAVPILEQQWLRLDRHQRFEEAEDAARSVLLKVQEKLRRENYRAFRTHFARRQADGPTGKDATGDLDATPRVRGSFKPYLKATLVRATIDYQRCHPHFRRASQAKTLGSRAETSSSGAEQAGWISFVSAHSRVDAVKDPVTLMNTARAMLSYLDEASEIALSLSLAAAQPGATATETESKAETCQEIARRLNLVKAREGCTTVEPDVEAVRHLLKHGASYRQAIELHVHGWHQSEIGEALGLTRRVTQRVLVRAQALLRARFAPAEASSSESSDDNQQRVER
jgi:hypothetical protein